MNHRRTQIKKLVWKNQLEIKRTIEIQTAPLFNLKMKTTSETINLKTIRTQIVTKFLRIIIIIKPIKILVLKTKAIMIALNQIWSLILFNKKFKIL